MSVPKRGVGFRNDAWTWTEWFRRDTLLLGDYYKVLFLLVMVEKLLVLETIDC